MYQTGGLNNKIHFANNTMFCYDALDIVASLIKTNNHSVAELELNQIQMHNPFKCHSILKTILFQKFDKTQSK